MYKIAMILSFFLLQGVNVYAQQETISNYSDEARLENQDIPKFLKTFKPIMGEMNALGERFNTRTTVSEIDAIKGRDDVQQILDKYGWDEDYFVKFSIIMLGYAQLKVEHEFNKMPDDQKEMMKQMGIDHTKMNYVHSDDMSLLRPSFESLDELFKELEAEGVSPE